MPAEEDRPCAPGEAEALPPRYTETPFLDEIIYDTTARYQNAAEFTGGVIWENKEVRLDACFTVPAQLLCIQNSTIHFQDSINSFFDLQNGAGLRFVNCRFDLCRTGAGKAPETRFRAACGRLIFEKCRFEELSALVKTNVEDEAAFGLELQIEACDFFDCADAIACAGSSLDFKNNNVVFTKPGSRFLTVCQTAPVLHGCTFRLTCAGGTGGHALLSLPPKTVLQECGFYGLRAPFSVSGSLVLEKCTFEACRQLLPGDVPIKAAESRFLGCTRVTDAAVIKPEQPVAFELTACHFTECSETLLLRYAILNMDRCFFQNGQGTQIKLEDSVSTLSGSGFSHIQSDGTPLLLYSGKKPDAAVGADALRLARKKGWKAADRHLVDQCTFEDICLTGKAALLAVSDEDSDLTVLVRHCRFKEIEAAGPVFRTQGIRDVAYGLGDSHTYLAIDIDRESCEFAPGSIYDPQQATSDAKLRGPITPGTKAKKAAAAVGGAVLGLAVSPIVAGMVAVDTAKDAFDPDDPLRSGLKAASGFISAGLAGLVLSPLGGGFELMDNVEEEHTGQNKKKRKK